MRKTIKKFIKPFHRKKTMFYYNRKSQRILSRLISKGLDRSRCNSLQALRRRRGLDRNRATFTRRDAVLNQTSVLSAVRVQITSSYGQLITKQAESSVPSSFRAQANQSTAHFIRKQRLHRLCILRLRRRSSRYITSCADTNAVGVCHRFYKGVSRSVLHALGRKPSSSRYRSFLSFLKRYKREVLMLRVAVATGAGRYHRRWGHRRRYRYRRHWRIMQSWHRRLRRKGVNKYYRRASEQRRYVHPRKLMFSLLKRRWVTRSNRAKYRRKVNIARRTRTTLRLQRARRRTAFRKMRYRVCRLGGRRTVIHHRRRFTRGKRLYAGIRGKRRWRAGRRDKNLIRRAYRRARMHAAAIYSTDSGLARLSYMEQEHRRRVASITTVGVPFANRSIRNALHQTILRRLSRTVPTASFYIPATTRQSVRLDSRYRHFPPQTLLSFTKPFRRFTVTSKLSNNLPKSATILQGKSLGLRSSYTQSKHIQTLHVAQKLLRARLLRAGTFPAAYNLSTPTATQWRVQSLSRPPEYIKSTNTSTSKINRNTSLLATFQPVEPQVYASANVVTTMSTVQAIISPTHARNRLRQNRPVCLPTTFLRVKSIPRVNNDASNNTLVAKRRQHIESRFYLHRPRLRLPRSFITRLRRRRGGHVTVVSKSLKYPRTHYGRQQLLLPPLCAYRRRKHKLGIATALHAASFASTNRWLNKHPRFWKLPPNRRNFKAVHAVRKRQYRRAREEAAAEWKAYKNFRRAVVASTIALGSPVATTLNSFLTKVPTLFSQERLARTKLVGNVKQRIVTRNRSPRYLSGLISRTERINWLGRDERSSARKRAFALWHLRSAQSMQAVELLLTAWTPQLRLKARRWAHPRTGGKPKRRKLLSFKKRRERRVENIRRLERGIPQLRYTDYEANKLQFRLGSTGPFGYRRYRRSYRQHSKHNYWWRPSVKPVPFIHPFSRRALTTKYYYQKKFIQTKPLGLSGYKDAMASLPGYALTMKFPGRVIPWRNFNYRRPRYGATPRTLRRWTYVPRRGVTTRAMPGAHALTLPRSLRALQKLSKYCGKYSLWADRYWQQLDTFAHSPTNTMFFAAISLVPAYIWDKLVRKSGSVSRAAAVQHKLLASFRSWLANQRSQLLSTRVATQRLLTLLAYFIKNKETAPTQWSQQYHCVAASSFKRRHISKQHRIFTLRELPKLLNSELPATIDSRSNNAAYRHWLHGAKGVLRKSQWAYSPTSRSRYTANVSLLFGRPRVRFPATARRRNSFDSMLQAFARKIAPPGIRRVSRLYFKRPKVSTTDDFRRRVLITLASFGTNRRRNLARRLSRNAYTTTHGRTLLNFVGINKHLQNNIPAKLRFMSLPLQVHFGNSYRKALLNNTANRTLTNTIRANVLRRALYKRRQSQLFIELRSFILHRKLPKDVADKPWLRRRTLRRKSNLRRNRYRVNLFEQNKYLQASWTLTHLSAVGLRPEELLPRRLSAVLSSGEVISAAPGATRYNKRAFVGFTLPTRIRCKKQLRRFTRRFTRKTRRGYRKRRRLRAKTVFRDARHWSERKVSRNMLSYATGRSALLARRFYRACRTKSKSNIFYRGVRVLGRTPNKYLAITPNNPNTPNYTTVTNLLRSSSILRRTRSARLKRKSKASRLRYRNYHRLHLSATLADIDKLAVPNVTPVATALLSASVARKQEITPLYLQRPVRYSVNSNAAPGTNVVALTNVAARYKITAQYLETLTVFIPELITQLISKKVMTNGKQLSYSIVQRLIKNIYWSLRVYLNVDPLRTRFALRDQKAAARVRLFAEISALSVTQKTTYLQRALLRYRFQPNRILRAPNTKRFRVDWLRTFFPSKHALYQEDSEDYGLFLLKTRNIRRLRLNAPGLSAWRTAHAELSLESRARKLLNLKRSRKRARFETALQTTRRTPSKEHAPVITKYLAPHAFFSRPFSSSAAHNAALYTKWVHRRRRFVSAGGSWRTVTPVNTTLYRDKLLSTLETRGRSNYLATPKPSINNTLLDVRFVRAKSPRSRQYLLRTPAVISQKQRPERQLNFISYKFRRDKYFTPKDANTKWVRCRRRSLSFSLQRYHTRRELFSGSRRKHCSRTTLQAMVAGHLILKCPAVLTDASSRAVCQLINKNKIVTGKKQIMPVTSTVDVNLQRFSKGYGRAAFARGLWRIATNRTVTHRYQITATMVPGSVLPSRKLLETAEATAIAYRAAQRTGLRNAKRWSIKTVGVKASRKLCLFARHADKKHKNVIWHTKLNYTGGRYFKSTASRQLMRRMAYTAYCGTHSQKRRSTPFDLHRSHLWNKLTLRWMKKFRIGRYWIRNTTHWLRDPWLSKIVACDMSLRPDRIGGELPSRPQQIGEYVAEVDARGQDIPESRAITRERHIHVLPARKKKQTKPLGLVKTAFTPFDIALRNQRLQISKIARRKPVPAMWLANYEFRGVVREHRAKLAKSAKQRAEEEKAQIKDYWARKTQNLPPEKPRREALKHPAGLWLPRVIWRDIARRVRRFEWRESDKVFHRRGFRNAFSCKPAERSTIPWLEPLMYNRTTYSTRLHEFRRRQFPHEQKKYKWLQRVRRFMYSVRRARYVKYRRWRQLRRYNQKLHYSLFNFPDRNAARRHFKKVSRRTQPQISGFVSATTCLTNRLDVVLTQLRIVPTIYWARIVSKFGLVRINSRLITNPAHCLHNEDFLQFDWDKIQRFQHYFKPHLHSIEEYKRKTRSFSTTYPTNFEYHPGTRTFIYKHAPDTTDLRKSNRLSVTHFRWFKLDSV